MEIAFVHRGRVNVLSGAQARPLTSNAWEIRFTVTESVRRFSRRSAKVADWDGVIFLIDDRETEPAIATGATGDRVTVTVMIL